MLEKHASDGSDFQMHKKLKEFNHKTSKHFFKKNEQGT